MPDETIGPDVGAHDPSAEPPEPPVPPHAPSGQADQPHPRPDPSPPGARPSTPPGSSSPPSGHEDPPGGYAYPHSEQPSPPGGYAYPHSEQPYPPGGHSYPPGGSAYPPGGQQYAPPGSPYPPGGQPYPPADQPYPPGGHAYAPGGQPYPTPGAPGMPPPQPGGPGGPYGSAPHGYAWPYIPPTPKPPLTPEARRSRRRWVVTLVAVVVLALGAGVGIGAAIAPASPKSVATALLHRSVSAAAQAGSYHYVERSRILGARDDITGDALAGGGSQLIKQQCKTGLDVFDLRLVRGVVYFRGNDAAVIDQLGVPTARAGPVVGQWVKVTRSESPYASFAVGITAKSNISQLPSVIVPSSTRAVPGSSPPATQIVGALYSGKGKPPIGTAVLDVVSASALPSSLRGSANNATGRYAVSWTFSHFGERTSVAAPSSPVAYTSLHAKKPSTSTCV